MEQLHGLLISHKQPKLGFSQSDFTIFHSIIYPLEIKDRKSLRNVLDGKALKITFH